MARQYLRLGDRKIPVSGEQAKELSLNRFNPKRVEEIKSQIFATASVKTEAVEETGTLQVASA